MECEFALEQEKEEEILKVFPPHVYCGHSVAALHQLIMNQNLTHLIKWNSQLIVESSLCGSFDAHRICLVLFALDVVERM